MSDTQPEPQSDRTGRNAPVDGDRGFPGELVDRPDNLPGQEEEADVVRPDQAGG